MKLYYANSSLEDADLVVLGLPYDRTSSFLPGSRFGPQYIRQCADSIEDYSPYQEKSLLDLKICDLGNIEFSGEDWLAQIETRVRKIYDKTKRMIFLGGEHTITPTIVRAIKKAHRDISLVQFDAHCDLRDEYLGEKNCHATAIRRAIDTLGADRVYQFGIRSGTGEEFASGKHLYKFSIHKPLSEVINEIKEPIYISIDVDVLDPGVLPAVSTPEPGGVTYRELIDALLLLRGKEIAGADIVEYNPLAASPWPSGSTVAELLRELILVMTHRV
jgi:agmatinase